MLSYNLLILLIIKKPVIVITGLYSFKCFHRKCERRQIVRRKSGFILCAGLERIQDDESEHRKD